MAKSIVDTIPPDRHDPNDGRLLACAAQHAESGVPASAVQHPPIRRLPPLLRKAWYGLNQAFRRRIKPHGATPDQFTILRLLHECDAEGLTQRTICQLMSSDANTMTALIVRMEEQKLVTRRPDENDKRAQRVTVAAKGKTLFKKLRAQAEVLQGDILLALPPERREQFLADLDAIAESCRKMAEEAGEKADFG